MSTFALGVERGLITWRGTNFTREGVFNLVFYNAIPLIFLIISRDSTLPGTDIPIGGKLLPGMLALMVVFSVMGVAYYLSTEREDGTLLRAKAIPNGMSAYTVGLAVVVIVDTVAAMLIVFVPGMFIVPDVPVGDPMMWIGLVGYFLLGLLACLPLGVLIGSLIKSPRVIGGFGFLLTMGLAMISGLFFPLDALWGWVQALVQVFPLYWLGLGMRSVFLPAEAAAFEIGESWRTLETLGALGAWTAIGLVLGPILLRRVARRESGAAMEERRTAALQRV